MAGFSVRCAARDWNNEAKAPMRRAVSLQLEGHMPFPGLAVDRLWTIRQANPAAVALFAPCGVGVGGSLLELMTLEVLPLCVENWPEAARHAALRLRTESTAQGVHSGIRKRDTIPDDRRCTLCGGSLSFRHPRLISSECPAKSLPDLD